MIRRLIWDPAPGEVRAVLLEEGLPVELHLIRTCHAQPTAQAGERQAARIVSKLGNGRALVQLETGEQALLHPVPQKPEGAQVDIEITRPRLPEPGRWKRAIARPAEDGVPALNPVARLLERADEIVCRDAASANLLVGHAAPVIVDPQAVDEADIDALLDAARSGLFDFEGGQLSIERTRAMTVIDVDGTAAPADLNRAAARAIPRALRLFGISGPVGVDFVSMASRADRQSVDAVLEAQCAALGAHERTAINGYGFCQIIRPRPAASIPEMLCGTTPGRLSVETQALMLLREAVRSAGFGARCIMALPAVINLLRAWPDALAQVARQTGADVKLVSDARVAGYGHVHVAQS